MLFDFEQHKYRNLIQKKSMDPYVAKMIFLQSRQMKVQKNLARLRGGNILTSCMNAQPIIINLLGK